MVLRILKVHCQLFSLSVHFCARFFNTKIYNTIITANWKYWYLESVNWWNHCTYVCIYQVSSYLGTTSFTLTSSKTTTPTEGTSNDRGNTITSLRTNVLHCGHCSYIHVLVSSHIYFNTAHNCCYAHVYTSIYAIQSVYTCTMHRICLYLPSIILFRHHKSHLDIIKDQNAKRRYVKWQR